MLLEFKNVKVGYNPDTEVEINNKKYLIHGVIEGEDILVETDAKYPYLKEITKKSPHRIPFNEEEVGGAQFHHIDYEYELLLKKKYLNELFAPFHLPEIKINRMDNPYNYRNKSQMTYKLSKTKRITYGLYEEYSHNIITADNNILQSEKANLVIKELNKILVKHKIRPYDEKTRTGNLRHVLVRYGFNSKELMVVLITNGEMFPGRNNVLTDLKKLNLGITTVVQNFNSRDTSIVLGDKEKVLYGPGFIYEYVGDYKFKISPQSFFQVNTNGMKILYDLAMKNANITKNDIVIDAYSGVGTISIFAAKYAKQVYGVELNRNAVFDAKINAKINNIKNVEFICNDATNYLTNLARIKEHVDVVIMDPPRDGSTKAFINAIKYLGARKAIYISCNPETLKRDLYQFFENGYVLKSIESVDMFPKTVSLECVAVLELKEDKLEETLKKINTQKFKENKIKYIPKADIEMMREDKYEAYGFKNNKNKKR